MSAPDITVRPYRPGDEDGILRLFNEVFAEDDPAHALRSRAHWEWEFLENPAGTQVVLGVEPNGRIIAQYACLPAIVHLAGRRVCCGQGIDSVVHKDYRRGLKREGAFLKTAKYYFEHYGVPEVNAFGYGFPNKKAYRIGVRMLGYVPIATPVKTLARNLINFKNDAEASEGGDPAGSVVPIDRFDERSDRLWGAIEAKHAMAIVRDARYLNWRYVDCPSVEHESFGLEDGAGGWRATWTLRRNWMGPPILAVCELIADPKDVGAIARALAHVCRYAREHGQQRVEIWVPPTTPVYDTILARGFKAESSPFNLCVKIYDPALDAAWARANWYYTIGDSDVF
ncbi:MAG: GNAT family N-acetyltransferase [Planctomycetota bacterium JB042]